MKKIKKKEVKEEKKRGRVKGSVSSHSMMKVDGFEIFSSTYCFILKSPSGRSSYYNSINSLLSAMLQEKIKETTAKDIREFTRIFRDIANRMESLCNLSSE